MSLIDAIREQEASLKGTLGVSVKHIDTQESISLNGDMVFPTASVFKIPVIVEFYRQVDEGKISLEERTILRELDKVPGSGILKELNEGLSLTYRDLVSLMMIISDNTATDIITEKVGFTNINDTIHRLGLEKTKVTKYCRDILFDLVGINDLPREKMTLKKFDEASEKGEYGGSWSLGTEDNNLTTPNEMNELLELILEGKAASPESCKAILDTMAKCQTGTYRIPKYLPRDRVVLYRKTGSLPGIRNDVGIVSVKETGERYIISCFTMGAEDVYAAEEAIARISQAAYNYFTAS